MATLKDYRDERLRKLDELKQLGINPYPSQSKRSHNIEAVHANFAELEGQPVSVVGRIVSIRKFGKLAFIVIKDDSDETLQLFMRKGETAAEADRSRGELVMPDEVGLLDTGDFVEAHGAVMKTQTGEISVGVKSLRLLTKALRPMPAELTDKEERLRRRYVDMNVNTEVRQRFVRRSKFWQATRDFLNERGFIEVNIPVSDQNA